MIRPPEDFRWPHPWAALEVQDEAKHVGFAGARAEIFGTGAIAGSLAAELQREVCPAHPLAGLQCEAVGFNKEDENEFIFVTDSPKIPVAFVHLTWEVERNPKFPWTHPFSSFEEFRKYFAEGTR
jgi:hypothetical protein